MIEKLAEAIIGTNSNMGAKFEQDYIVEDCSEMFSHSRHESNGHHSPDTPYYITVENEGRMERLQIDPPEESQFTIQGPYAYNNSGYRPEVEDSQKAIYKTHPSTSPSKGVKKENKKQRRIVAKSGETNVSLYNVNERKKQYLKDIFTTMVDMRWRYTLLAFVSSFFLSWLLFGVFWWLICLIHGDFLLDHANVSLKEYEKWLEHAKNGSQHVPCVTKMKDFTSAFLFSVETQHTIGYGSRYTTEECPQAIILQCIQSIVGVVIQACMVGIVFAKLSRPNTRQNTVLFSSNACVTQRNGDLYLQFRVGNMRTSKLLESHVSAVFVHHNKSTEEGEDVHFHQETLQVGSQLDGEDENVFLFWPIIVSHKIGKDSPLYRMGPEDIIKSHFEILVILDGIIEPTGNSMQARTSYLPNEIMWGHRFDNMVKYSMKQGVYAVDCSQLNVITSDNTPRCSAAQLDQNPQLKQNLQIKKRQPSLMETGRFLKQFPRKRSTDSGYSWSTAMSSVTPQHVTKSCKKLSKTLSFYLEEDGSTTTTTTTIEGYRSSSPTTTISSVGTSSTSDLDMGEA